MEDVALASFYRGWLIQILQNSDGYRSVCLSPAWRKISSKVSHAEKEVALCSARAVIDRQFACQQLLMALRDLYEEDRLSFDEWRSLTHSLRNRSVF